MTISTTTNLGLKKPVLGTAEDADITTINDNMDTLDAAVGAVDVDTDGSLQEQINDLGESVYKFVPFTVSIPSTAAGAGGHVNVSVSVPSGYVIAGIIVWSKSGFNLFPVWGKFDPDSSNPTAVGYQNNRTSACDNVAMGFVMCKKQ